MVHALALLEVSVLVLIATIHLYWTLGGRWAASAVVPTRAGSNDRALFPTPPLASLAVAVLLLIAAWIVLERLGWTQVLPAWIGQVGIWGIVAAFGLRSLGEFRYVGWFKRVTGTRFARLDTQIFTPLTTALALSSLVLALA
jgi:Protein of unknown function (DUF3995)